MARTAADPRHAVAWIAAAPAAAIPGLGRKLPHYTRYSYLAFRGSEPENVAKGMWKPLSSPMVRNLSDGAMPELDLPARTPLAELPPPYDADVLLKTVEELADPELEGRGLGTEGLDRATEIVEAIAGWLGVQKRGGSKLAGFAALVGGLIGAVVGSGALPIIGTFLGMLAGSFALAFLVEWNRLKHHGQAATIAWGTVLSRLSILFIKTLLTLGMSVYLIIQLTA